MQTTLEEIATCLTGSMVGSFCPMLLEGWDVFVQIIIHPSLLRCQGLADVSAWPPSLAAEFGMMSNLFETVTWITSRYRNLSYLILLI